jgi:hypothetical protein
MPTTVLTMLLACASCAAVLLVLPSRLLVPLLLLAGWAVFALGLGVLCNGWATQTPAREVWDTGEPDTEEEALW